MTAAITARAKLGIDTSSPVGVQYEFVECNLALTSELVDTSGINGTRHRYVDRIRQSFKRVAGNLKLNPTAVELAALLGWPMGGTPVTASGVTTYNLGETTTARYVTIDRISKVFTYAGVKVDKFKISGNQGLPVTFDFDLVGTTETVGNAGTFPSLSLDDNNTPFMFHDAVFSINSTTVTCKNFEFQLDNMIDRDRFFNAVTLGEVVELDRKVTASFDMPYGDWYTLYTAGKSGVATVVTFTNGGAILTMHLPKLAFPDMAPPTPPRGTEHMLRIQAMGMGDRSLTDGTGDEVWFTLNPGP